MLSFSVCINQRKEEWNWEGGQVVILPMLAGERRSFLLVVKVGFSLLLSEVRSDGCELYTVSCTVYTATVSAVQKTNS